MKILYLEDSQSDADLTRRSLNKADSAFEILLVRTIAEAIEQLDHFESGQGRGEPAAFDLALLDMHLPDGNGLSVLSEIRNRSLPLAVVVLTGSGDEESVSIALRSGANDYMVKRNNYWIHLPVTLHLALQNMRSQHLRRLRPIRLLYVESSPGDIDLTRRYLAAHASFIHFQEVISGAQALSSLPKKGTPPDFDVLLLDYRLPDMNALDILKEIYQIRCLSIPAIITTGLGSEEIAIQAIKLGALDYIVKESGYLTRLPMVIEAAFYRSQVEIDRAALRNSEHRLRTIIETNPEGVLLLGERGDILEINPAGLVILGTDSIQTSQRQSFFEYVTLNDQESFHTEFNNVLGGKRQTVEIEILTLTGSKRFLEIHAAPMFDSGAEKTLFLGIIRDITEKKSMESQLRQTLKMNAMGQLAGGVAHDFNNQLAAILGYAEMLSMRLHDSVLKRIADTIATAAQRSGELTRSLLTFARQAPSLVVATDIHILINETIALLNRTIDKRISISCQLDAKETLILGDPAQLQNALLNLGINARDAMAEGGHLSFSTHTISIASGSDSENGINPDRKLESPLTLNPGRYIQVTVKDSGSGMTPEVKERLFEPFFTTKAVGKGTGMGLASVFGTVKVHHGSIEVASELGLGTSFRLLFPLTQVAPPEAKTIGTVSAPSKSMSILIVEDMLMLRELLSEILIGEGHRVVTATNGLEGVALYEKKWREIDLVMLDMIMPGLNGLEAFSKMKQVNPNIAALLSSGFAPGDDIQQILKQGILGIVQKPYRKASLMQAILTAMEAFPRQG